jgi:GNAT superfamily N-acetyltransferase
MQTHFADALSPAQSEAIADLLYRVWPDSTRSYEDRLERVAREWAGYDGPDSRRPRYFAIWDESLPMNVPPKPKPMASIAALALAAPRDIRFDSGIELTILALARVCTAPQRRGEGLGAQVVRSALQMVDDDVYPFALFQTTPPVRAFYEKLGACGVKNRIINSHADDPTACPFWSEVIMRYPAGPGWPAGIIDLMGPGY